MRLVINVLIEMHFERANYLSSTIMIYADDVSWTAQGASVAEMMSLLDENARLSVEWAHRAKMKFASEKTQFLTSWNDAELVLNIDGVQVKQSSQITILGLTIDKTRTYRTHMMLAAEKCQKRFHSIRALAVKRYGISSAIMKKLYLTIVEPTFLHCAEIYGEGLEKATGRGTKSDAIRQKLRSLVIFISRAYCTTPTISLFALAGVDLPDVKIRERFEIGRRNFQHVTKCATSDQVYPPLRKPFNTQIIRETSGIEEIYNALDIYTDGSKSGGLVGAAVVAYINGFEVFREKIKLASWCSSFQAEQVAIAHALRYAQGRAQKIRVFTDCQAIVVAACSSSTKDRLMKALFDERTNCEVNGGDVQLNWIKGHNGLLGNEIADRLANEAANETKMYSFDWKSRVSVKHEVREELAIVQNLMYTDNLKITKKLDSGEKKSNRENRKKFWAATFPSFSSAKRYCGGRRTAQWLTHSLTGHGPFGSYLFEFGIYDRENTRCECQAGRESELRESSSVWHAMTSCAIDGVATRRARLADAMLCAGIVYGEWSQVINKQRLGDLFFEVLRENYRNCVVANARLQGYNPEARLARSGVNEYGKQGQPQSGSVGGRVFD
jgi:ribonuclease HI